MLPLAAALPLAAGLMNALELQGKTLNRARIVLIGAGAAAVATAHLLIALGATRDNMLMVDLDGVLHSQREDLDAHRRYFAQDTRCRASVDACCDADVIIGLSGPGAIQPEMLRKMASKPIVFALANPDPEIMPAAAHAVRTDLIMATGRSDFPNQVNNVLGFPFIFRGALDVRAAKINQTMHCAAVEALARLSREPVPTEVLTAYGIDHLEFGPEYIIPTPFDPRLRHAIPAAVAQAAIATGVARITN